MAAQMYVIIFAILSASCHAQLAGLLLPGVADSARGITDALFKQPSLQETTVQTGNLFLSVLNALTAVPIAAARSFGQIAFPNLIAESNIGDMSGIVADFSSGSSNEDAKLSVGELIVKYGYPMEKHKVVTEDGYKLSMFRIPSNGTAVFLMHGLLGSADDYVVAGPDSGLAYLLSKEGYDVWMGNARGNKHSRRHVQYKPSEAAFWDFSWHEIGFYDLPAMIDYVLNTTEQKTLKYVGHSQGTTTFFVMASERPEYNSKISLMVALSPVAFMSHMTSPFIRMLAPTGPVIHGFLKSLGVYEFLPDTSVMRSLKYLMCGTGSVAEIMCSNVLFLLAGFGFDHLNATNLPVIYGHAPSGAASKQLAHFGQGIVSGEFRRFDYGSYGNQLRYGSEKPPKYNLSNIAAPIALFYSDADWLSHPTDVDELYNNLDSAIDIYKVPTERFNHLDFIWAKDFRSIIYKRLKKMLKHFE